MTFFAATGHLTLPRGSWFRRTLAVRRELDETPYDDRFDERGRALNKRLDDLHGVTLRDANNKILKELRFTFLHYHDESRRLVLSVAVENDSLVRPRVTSLDGLFSDQYDPAELRLTEEDVAYVIVQLDEQGQPQGRATVIQPHGEKVPKKVCALMPTPTKFISRLFELAA